MRSVVLFILLVFGLATVVQAGVDLQLTEIYAGTSNKNTSGFDTSEWFEVTNFGDTAADMVADPVYYDDESADPTKNSLLMGVDTIAPGESVVFLVDWESDMPEGDDAVKLAEAYSRYATAWGPLPGVKIGYVGPSAGGLGGGGDTMYLFDGNLAGANVIDSEGYGRPPAAAVEGTYVSLPDGTWNGYDTDAAGLPSENDLAGFNGLPGWAALVTFGDVDPITLLGSPGGLVQNLIPGDTNYDYVVDEADAATLAGNWLLSGDNLYWKDGDFNGDNIVNDADATILASNLHVSNQTASVPEPSLCVLVLSLLAGVTIIKRRLN